MRRSAWTSLAGLPLRLLLLLPAAVLPAGCLSAFVYFPDREIRPIPARLELRPEWAFFAAADGARVSAWHVPREDARGLVLFFHGNGGNVSHYTEALALFHALGYASLIVDYHGYGKSEGTPSESATYLDAEAAWTYLTAALKIPPGDVIVWGRSLGGAVAAWLAGQHTPRLLVLESSFTSLRDAAAHLYAWAPTRLLLRDMYRTERLLDAVTCPVLVIHSPDDEMIPYTQGRRLFERARGPKRFLPIRGGHNTGDLGGVTSDLLDPRTWDAPR